MPRNGNGTYVLPTGQPVVPATTVSSATFNALVSDLSAEVTRSLSTDGQTPMAAALPMNGNKIVGLGAATQPTDVPQLSQVLQPATIALPSGASLVGYLPSGPSAISRTVQDKSRESASVRDFGGVGDDATDNKNAIDLLFAYCSSTGARPYFPCGRYRTSGAHTLTVANKVASPYGDGPAASVIVATGDQDLLTITGCSECAVRGLGFDKVTRNALGQGLVIKNTAYAMFDHVTAYGFLNGFYTQDVLTTLFNKALARFCDIGLYLDFTNISRPNAITLLNCSFSLNNRWGMRATQPASLLMLGGSIEGNGWGQTSFHGGMYISNAGTEGGVGVTIQSVHMEQNQGTADIHIATTQNPGTVYNIQGNACFSIDNVHNVDNRVYVENNVPLTLNLNGNSFKSFGTYTPSSSRKYVKSEAPTLVSLNTGGDTSQFYDAIETPDFSSWGPVVYRGAMLAARVSVAINGAPAAVVTGSPYNVATVNRTAAGQVNIYFIKPQLSTDYQVSASALLGAKTICCTNKQQAYFTIETRDLTGTLVDSGFDAMVAGGV